MITAHTPSPTESLQHITPEYWSKANRVLIRKALSEFAHELLIHPEFDEKENRYTLVTPTVNAIYFFKAKLQALNHWSIVTDSIEKRNAEGEIIDLNLFNFIIEFKEELGITETLLPTYLEEINSTLYATAYKLANAKYSSEELVTADYQTIEHAMMEGHPCFLANSGKNGFNALDFIHYSPEADAPIQLLWLGGHKSRATFSAIESLTYDKLMGQELDVETFHNFQKQITNKGCKSDEYYMFPVHPWQWFNKLSLIFADDIAHNYLIPLGYGKDIYSAQQSIRTFFNLSKPKNFYAKTALSVINMGFMRGLSPYYMESTPSITKWVADAVENDTYLQSKGFTLLGEVATLGYRNLLFEPLGRAIPHNKMLATLWRESPLTKLKEKQQCMTMAALLHIDTNGEPLVKHLIQASGRNAADWIADYLDAYLAPLLHCFYAHEMVFMPHGENLILAFENHSVKFAFMKDITEEVMVFNPKSPLSEKAKRIHIEMPEKLKPLCIQNDVFQHFFRFLSSILDEHNVLDEEQFWNAVSECISKYQQEHPQYQELYAKYDLFTATFDSCCLNRLQLKNNKQMLDLASPTDSLQFVGQLKNPVQQIEILA
jgi:siderophore synthetase component